MGGWEARGLRPAQNTLPKIADFLGYEPAAAATPSELARSVAALRLRLRLPRSEMAEKLGVSYAALWAWEVGKRRPRGRFLVLLQTFLNGRQP